MRQIKYRCYHIVKKQYLDLLAIDFTYAVVTVMEIVGEIRFSEFEVAPDYIETSYKFDKVILEQFTGLLDKDGKEIYEGDIVEYVKGCGLFSNLPIIKPPEYGEKFVVVNLKSGFTLVPQKSYHNMPKTCDGELIPNVCGYICNYDFWNGQRSLRVIGNIHEEQK